MELYIWGKSSGTLWNFIMGLMEGTTVIGNKVIIKDLAVHQVLCYIMVPCEILMSEH